MKFRMTVEMDNEAFAYTPATELRRIMVLVARKIGDGEESGKVHDKNGNTVGSWEVR